MQIASYKNIVIYLYEGGTDISDVWNRMLTIIFGYRREELAGGCGELHNEGLHNL